MKKFISSLLVFTLLFGATVLPCSVEVSAAKTLEDYNDEYEALEKQLEQKEASLKNAASAIEDKEAYVSSLNEQIGAVQEQIDVLDERIALLNSDIAILNASIDKLAAEIAKYDVEIKNLENDIVTAKNDLDVTFEQLKERLRASYISGNASVMEMLLTSEDVSSFLVRAEFVKRTAENDNKLMDSLNEQIDKLNALETEVEAERKEVVSKKAVYDEEKAELVASQNDLQSSLNILETKQNELSNKKTEVASMIDKLNKDSQTYKNQIAQIESDMLEVESLIQSITASAGNSGSSSGTQSSGSTSSPTVNSGGWLWPVKASGTYISSPYGYRYHPITGTYKMHTGIDITAGGVQGKPVIASKAGTVIYTNYGYGGGYGNYLIVDHGGGYTTLYAHCDSLAVSNGQKVSQGQTIAYVGNTGASTGPHLHFEVRINGNHTNPSNYVSQ